MRRGFDSLHPLQLQRPRKTLVKPRVSSFSDIGGFHWISPERYHNVTIMAFSLHRKSNSPYWFAFVRIPDADAPGGYRQTSRTTKRTKKAEAEAEARTIESALLKEAGADTETSRGLFGILEKANAFAIRGELTETRARQFLAEMLEVSTGHGIAFHTVKGYFDGWLADKEKANAKGTWMRYQGVVSDFLAALPETRRNGNLMALAGDDVRRFRDAELASGKSASTVNDAVKTIRTALNRARKTGLILSNPAEAVELVAETKAEKGIFPPSAIASLLAAVKDSDADWRGLILAGYYTGANLRDLTELRWQNIDLAAGTLSFSRRKTGRAVTVPLHPELSAWLMARPSSDDPKAPVFPALVGKSTAGKSGLSMKFARIMADAKISGETTAPEAAADKEAKTKGRARNALTFHSLRHSFNSAMANAGVSQELRMLLTGHASGAMNKVYTHHEMQSLKAAVEKVPGIGKGGAE